MSEETFLRMFEFLDYHPDPGPYCLARAKLCHTCWKWELGPEFADIWLIFHEIAEAYPDSPK